MHIFFSVGEPSGDQHAAHLMQELRRRRPDVRFSGYGGPLMEKAGCRLHYRLTNLAVMGVLQVVPLLWRFVQLVRQAGRLFRETLPDAVVLVDFPGFNWWIARKAKAVGIPVYYYLPPQLWAWAPWRVKRMRKFVDRVICGLPFEQKWYADRGVSVDYVGHPFFDDVARHPLDRQFREAWPSESYQNVGVLPGSRNHEVKRNWPVMLRMMRQLHAEQPNVRFLVACYKQQHLEFCRGRLEADGMRNAECGMRSSEFRTPHSARRTPNSALPSTLPVHFFVGKTPEVIDAAKCCLMVSGSVSLEMLARTTPAVVIYCCTHLFYYPTRLLVTVQSITLPNLISGRTILPEYVIVGQTDRKIEIATAILNGWLTDNRLLTLSEEQLAEVRDEVAQTGASGRAADVILNRLTTPRAVKAA